MSQIAIIGGGASGLTAAIAAAQGGAAATVFERGDRMGASVLRTGNGRCNLTNTTMAPESFNDPRFVGAVMQAFVNAGTQELLDPAAACTKSVEGIEDFFTLNLGLLLRHDDEGRVYPLSNSAASVSDVLRLSCRDNGVKMRTNTEVSDILRSGAGFDLYASSGLLGRFDKVVLACGGGAKLAARLGIDWNKCRPMLTSLAVRDPALCKRLDGVRVRARATLSGSGATHEETGELLFRKYGLSGIMIFDLSRLAQPGDTVTLDLLPGLASEALQALLEERVADKGRTDEEVLCGILHPAIAREFVAFFGRDARALTEAIKAGTFTVDGPGDVKNAQVSRGGLANDAFKTDTLECVSVPGLFACGEVLDVDGRCGGYNLHWAWVSGLLAGASAAEE